MELRGRCYCGDVRYEVSGDPVLRLQCHCRECQYVSGGSPNVTIGMPAATFRYTQGEPAAFTRDDLPQPVTREFCGRCGTQLLSKAPGLPGVMLLKVGTLDDPSVFAPDMAIFTAEKQPFHRVPEGIATFERMPG